MLLINYNVQKAEFGRWIWRSRLGVAKYKWWMQYGIQTIGQKYRRPYYFLNIYSRKSASLKHVAHDIIGSHAHLYKHGSPSKVLVKPLDLISK